ncbi:hypothetical protein EUGRSUZ_L02263 [Eucalyptus grandis]|uniref:Histidine-containing phosphotransfer protein n=1 Tax=Eucalyptus grandis TaxID=71139 RepID=A0A058ZSF6_EUCGR|nr:hypothetical protein EUGRSUZ_L02263 [Eucalyptus grandis]
MDADLVQMQKKLADYQNALFKEGILDSQYLELHELQDESNPEFVVEVVYLFLADSEKLLDDLSGDLIGAPRIKNACIEFQKFCQEKNIRGCLRYLQQMKQEFDLVKSKLKALFALEQNVVAAGGLIPKMQPIDLID